MRKMKRMRKAVTRWKHLITQVMQLITKEAVKLLKEVGMQINKSNKVIITALLVQIAIIISDLLTS